MTLFPEDDQAVRQRWRPVIIAFVVIIVEVAVHVFTLGRVQSWLPGYPSQDLSDLLYPPAPIRDLHEFGPFLLLVAFAAVFLTSFLPTRFKRLRPTLFAAGGGTIFILLFLYSWALLWVVRVSRYVE